MGEYESKLRDLAEGAPWTAPGIGALIKAIGAQQAEVQRSIAVLPQHWKGQSGDVLLARLKVHDRNLGYLQERLYRAQQQITGTGQYSCAAGSDNQERVRLAQDALNSLPSSIIPQGVLDAVNQGAKTVEVVGVGVVKVGAQTVGWVTDQLLSGREAAAKKAFDQIESRIEGWSENLKKGEVRFDPIPEFGKAPTPVPPLVYDTGGVSGGDYGGAQGVGGSGIASLVGGGGDGFPGYLGGPGGGPGGGPVGWIPSGDTMNPGGAGNPGGGGSGSGSGDGSGGGNGGGSGGGNGGGSGGGNGVRPVYSGDDPTSTRPGGPSVDSGLEGGRHGFGVGAGLGAAGLGVVGLAAGAKVAGGVGGAGFSAGSFGIGGMGFGGAGAGAGAAGAGTAGMAGTTGAGSGAGGANSGAGAAKGAGTGAGKPGMMMGGQGGGAADKKGGVNRLGYVAPKFEDDHEESMPHPASRAGKRGE